MNKRLARNIWLLNKYTQEYIKATGRYKEKLANKLEELQETQTDLVKNFEWD